MPIGPIQPRLPGFLDMLQLKTRGQVPPALADLISGTIDLTHWYAVDRVEQVADTATPNINIQLNQSLFGSVAVIPGDEYWMLFQAQVFLALDVPNTTALFLQRLLPCYQGFSDGIATQLADDPPIFDSTDYTAFPGTSAVIMGSKYFERPLLLRPNARLGAIICGEITATVQPTLHMRFNVAKLKV